MSLQRYNFRDFLQRFIDQPDECEFFKIATLLPATHAEGPWIAGGALRRTLSHQALESDVDFFFKDAAQKSAFHAAIIESESNGWLIAEKDHATTFGVKDGHRTIIAQAITMSYYENLDAVLDSFDFTITQFGYDGSDLVCGEYALWDLARKRLALHKLTYGVSTVRRLIKYTRQGFTACAGVMASILEATVANPAVIQSTVHYVD